MELVKNHFSKSKETFKPIQNIDKYKYFCRYRVIKFNIVF